MTLPNFGQPFPARPSIVASGTFTREEYDTEITRLRAANLAYQRALLHADTAVRDATALLRQVRQLLTGIER